MTQAFNLSQFANKVNTSGQADLTTAVTGTLPVANGGTNQTTYTDGQLLIGNSTGNTLTKATLTAGTGISVTNGSGAITIASTASGGFTNMQVFTTPGTFTTPASTTKIKVTVVGSGGGGGNPYSTGPGIAPVSNRGSGGGAGGSAIYVGAVSASTPYAITVGAASAAQTAGSTSSFGSLASATGGGAGTNAPSAVGGSGGSGTAGTLLNTGGQGGSSFPGPTAIVTQMGGSSIMGGTGAYGGGGASANSGVNPTTGIVIVEY